MVIGMLLAGGVGKRMGSDIPKQFLEVAGRPIIWYPLNEMENYEGIDAIEVVCVDNFIDTMWGIVKEYGFTKVKWITAGGATCQESTRNGLNNLKGKMGDDDIVLIHMSSYPLASAEIMKCCIESAEKNGNGCTARPILYSVCRTDDRKTSREQIERDKLMLCTVPYAFKFGECSALYDRAYSEGKGIEGNVFTNTLYCDYGKTIYFTKDSGINMKVTTPDDITLMETYMTVIKNQEKQTHGK